MKNLATTASRAMAQMIEQSAGKFVSVEFIKKDGSLRKLTGRMGVSKFTNGGERTTSEEKYIIINETETGKYKNVNKDTIVSLRANGVTSTNPELIKQLGKAYV